MAHHDLGARASEAGGDVRVHEDVDRGLIIGRGADDRGHRGDAGVRAGRDAERLVEVRGARRDLHDHRTGSARQHPLHDVDPAGHPLLDGLGLGRATVDHDQHAPTAGHGELAAQPQRRTARAARRVRAEPGDSQTATVGRERDHHVGSGGLGVQRGDLPVHLHDPGPASVPRHRPDLVDVAGRDPPEVQRPGVGRDPGEHLPRRGVAGRRERGQDLSVTGVDTGHEGGQRLGRLGRARPRDVHAPWVDLVASVAHQGQGDDGEHQGQRKAGRPQEWTTGLRRLLVSQGGLRRRRASSRGPRRRRRCRGWQRGRSGRCRCTCRRG